MQSRAHYVTDVHTTINHLLGIDPLRLEVPGDKRLDKDFGYVIHDIIAWQRVFKITHVTRLALPFENSTSDS
ncbi:MAG: hypothetical protein P8J27_00590 [Mariniblastus sp.]|nr:hypothetical protein [Mariniblastus sp.]